MSIYSIRIHTCISENVDHSKTKINHYIILVQDPPPLHTHNLFGFACQRPSKVKTSLLVKNAKVCEVFLKVQYFCRPYRLSFCGHGCVWLQTDMPKPRCSWTSYILWSLSLFSKYQHIKLEKIELVNYVLTSWSSFFNLFLFLHSSMGQSFQWILVHAI